ncbi:MAG: AbrB/MazE/SpoVT family DNA-binding domain-containing protein [Xenococcaceae cyanobacterium]
MKIGVVLRKWGNSVGLRIPAQILESLDLEENSQVTLEVRENRLIIEKDNPLPNLDEILDSIPDDFDYPEDISEFVDSQVVGEELL